MFTSCSRIGLSMFNGQQPLYKERSRKCVSKYSHEVFSLLVIVWKCVVIGQKKCFGVVLMAAVQNKDGSGRWTLI